MKKKTTTKQKLNKTNHVMHELGPVFNRDSGVLILGSMPSVLSRQTGFYYGHPQNRFWKIIACIYHCDIPSTIEQKKKLILNNHLALFDVIAECDIVGSSDSSITNVVVNDITSLILQSNIKTIILNGQKASSLFNKYLVVPPEIQVYTLPSTSPANAKTSFDDLVMSWSKVLKP